MASAQQAPAEAGANVVGRTVALLRGFAEAGQSVSIKELSARLGLPPSTLHRLLEQLLAAGMVERAPRRRYRVSAEFSRIGALAARKTGVLELARPVLEEVARETTETCLLGMLLPQTLSMMFIDKATSPLPLPYEVRMHRARSLLWGATGLGMLAWLDPAQVERILQRGEASPVDGQAPPEPGRLAARLAEIRARGYAMTRGEQTQGAVGMAAPVFGARNQVVADLCLTLPQPRFGPDDEARFAGLLTQRAAYLSRMMGHLPG
ncbi:IclR family transcriptional regulator [Falsiroseomonas sp.]|uniref:IclR family transcriptional regulator n=1 Tax=Falsiroseomonas sp. TaxID=2870721 RepID=UPI00271C7C9C|nr:IclR family transcriptional regulator [Falsiroseomonas sp.]MDO9500057.1 IclR family transcriptional regulator [Falsiroseomonas sp.]